MPGGAAIPIFGAVASVGLLAGAFVRIERGHGSVDFSDFQVELAFAFGSLLVGVVIAVVTRRSRRLSRG